MGLLEKVFKKPRDVSGNTFQTMTAYQLERRTVRK